MEQMQHNPIEKLSVAKLFMYLALTWNTVSSTILVGDIIKQGKRMKKKKKKITERKKYSRSVQFTNTTPQKM